MIKFDYQYVAGWSLARDIEILLATLPAVISGRGAYCEGDIPSAPSIIRPQVIDLHCHALPGVDDGPATHGRRARAAARCDRRGHDDRRRDAARVPALPDHRGHDRGGRRGAARRRPARDRDPGRRRGRARAGARAARQRAAPADARRLVDAAAGVAALARASGRCSSAAWTSCRSAATASCSPTRSARRLFLDRPLRLRALVEQGALCSITASALSGRFGQGAEVVRARAPARRPRPQRRLRRPRRARPPARSARGHAGRRRDAARSSPATPAGT